MIIASQQIPLFANEYLTFFLVLFSIISGFLLAYMPKRQAQTIKNLKEELNKVNVEKAELKKLRVAISRIDTICETALDTKEFMEGERTADYYMKIIASIHRNIHQEETDSSDNQKNNNDEKKRIIRKR
ncbi:MAG: hypothetical protein F6K54_16150 [Okeania sp. SIO3B5]|uniref:hypothetical protein n=1 Tax=Okeania sp. SIO3B5 TaxID=2607811 RepID=UPI0013FF3858|nr:hypothetical protein [Okeania sp. SIO3B5]NEO54476.1 hypothetical protein [Okeania sp. SIO3B5]